MGTVPTFYAALLALAATSASGAPRVTAKPAFSPLRSTDWGGVVVNVENDREPLSAELILTRKSGGSDGDVKVDTRLPLELGALARREVFLPLPPGIGTECRLDLVAAEQVLASAVARVEWARDERPLVGCIGEPPASLVAACRRDLDVPLVTIDPARLPGNEMAWPRFDAVAWPAPRATDLDAAQAAALRRHVLAGGRLVLGAIHEDVDVLERLGIADLAPAKLAVGDGLDVIALPRAGTTTGDGAVLIRDASLGSVRLVPRDLSRGEVPWAGLLGMTPPPKEQPATAGGWRPPGMPGGSSLIRMYPPQDLLDELTPHAPTWLAATLLTACLLAAVPLDAWLTRRALKRGRRSRFGWARYPAIILVTTALAYLLADRVGARDLVVHRIDVVDVREPEGAVMGRSLLVLTRGRSGELELEAEGAQWTGISRHGMYGDDARVEAHWLATADRDAPLSRARFDLDSWGIILAEARWVPDPSRFPHARPPTPDAPVHVPASLADGLETATGLYPLQNHACLEHDARLPAIDGVEPDRLLVALEHAEDGILPRVRIVIGGSFGPPLRVGGVDARPERTFTVIRYAFTEDATRALAGCFPEAWTK